MQPMESLNQQKVVLQAFIPPQYEAIALLSELMERYDVVVEILTAVWQNDSLEGNWLKLALHGSNHQLSEAITYFQEQGISLKILQEINLTQLTKERHLTVKAIAQEIEPLEEISLAS